MWYDMREYHTAAAEEAASEKERKGKMFYEKHEDEGEKNTFRHMMMKLKWK